MANVDGLRPSQSARPMVRQKNGRTVTNRDVQQQVRLRPSAAPVDTYVRPAEQAGVGENALMLAKSLSSLSSTLGTMTANQQKLRENEQKLIDEAYTENLKYHAERFTQDREVGAVNAAQLKEIAPDASPIVAAKLAQAIGKKEASTWIQDRIQGILEDDNIRLDSGTRQAEIAKIKAEAIEMVGDDPEHAFYGGGFLDRVSGSLAEFEMNWVRETAAHHENILAEDFSSRVEATLLSGGDLVALDADEGTATALDKLERKKIVFDTVLNTAMSSKDTSLLERLPPMFLNAENKQKVAQAKQQIQSARFTNWSQAKQYEEHNRKQQLLGTQNEILREYAETGQIDPVKWSNNPEAFAYATNIAGKPVFDTVGSANMSAKVRNSILQSGITGEHMPELQQFAQGAPITADVVQSFVANLDGINPQDRVALMEKVPELMNGVNFMRDPDVSTGFEGIDQDIRAFASSPYGSVASAHGINPQSEVRRAYYRYVQQEMNADLESELGIPLGSRKMEIIRGAEDAALRRFQQIQSLIKQSGDRTNQGAPVATAPQGNRYESPANNQPKTVKWSEMK